MPMALRIPKQPSPRDKHETIRVPALLSDSESEYSDIDPGSPSLHGHPSRKRKRLQDAPGRLTTRTTTTLPLQKTNAGQNVPDGKKLATEEQKSGSTFILNKCDCRNNHSPYTLALPAAWFKTYSSFRLKCQKVLDCDPGQGVMTDLAGNELWRLSETWSDYMQSGLLGLAFHSDFFSGVRLGDRAAAQLNIKRHLSHVAADGGPPASSSPAAAIASSETTLTLPDELPISHVRASRCTLKGVVPKTPPAKKIQNTSEEVDDQQSMTTRLSWTAKTSESGRITSLSSHRIHQIPSTGVLGVTHSAASEEPELILIPEDDTASRAFFDESHSSEIPKPASRRSK